MSYKRILALLFIALLAGWTGTQAAATSPARQGEVLRVATKSLPPFVTVNGEQLSGFSIELWDLIAQQIAVDYEWVVFPTVSDMLGAVQNSEVDIAIAGITITEQREEVMDFSFPYFDSGLQIMVRNEATSPIANAVNAILAPEMLQFLAGFLLLILAMAHVLWLVERRRNPLFPRGYLRGIGQALWWSTITAIGYDDTPPSTIFGRVLAVMWMFIAIFVFANLTASLSAAATVRELRSSIRGVADLQGQQVVTAAGTTSASFLEANNIIFSTVDRIDDAYTLLLDGEADAVVFDGPVLQYFIKSTGSNDLALVPGTFDIERYGIALPPGSRYREPINRTLLKLQEDGVFQELYNRWFGVAVG
jgi:polar amino acid transport system substrate-binding protein